MAERTNPHANLIIGAQDEATPVFDKIKASSQSMAAGVEQAATKAAGAVGGIGDKAAPAAQKLDGVTASMIRQVQRLNAELEAGSARNAAYFEKMANLKGADTAALAPYLAQLKQAEAAQRIATTGLDQMGMSAKQTTAALRQVPMQFTDIVVSLQGGQSAMQVFMQQGGQLKDLFGGIGPAARAMGGYVAGLVTPFTLAAAAIASIAVAYKQGSAEADGYRMALVMTGNAAGTTAAQMQQMAGRISSVVGTQGAAAEALAQMASSGRVASQSLEYFSEVAIKFERATGTAISETVKRFTELGASPVDASRKLNEETNYLTASIYEQIKALKDQGREADAAALAQNTYADALNNRSAQITQNLGAIEGAWKAIKDAAKSGWDAMLNVGRADSLGTQIDNMRAKIAQAKGQDKNRPFSMPWDTSLADLEKQLSYLTEQERVIRRGAEAQAQRTQAEKEAVAAADALQKTQTSGLTDQQKMNKALEEYARHIEKLKATNPASALLSPDAIARGEKAIRDQFSDKGKGSAGINAANKELADQAKLLAELNGLTGSFAKEWDTLSAVYAKGGMSLEQLTSAQATLLAKQPAIKAAADEQAKAQQVLAKANLDAAASREKYIASLATGLDKIQADIAAQEEATARLGLSKQAIADLDAAKLEMLATDLELQAIKAMDRNLDQQTYDALKQQAQAYRDLAKAKQAGAAKEVAVDEAKKAAEEWQRTSDHISQSITDSLMRGFESGKDFAKNLRDTVVNMFKSLVLQPVIKGIVSPFAGALTGALGLAGTAAQAGQGAGGALSAIGSVGSGYSLLSGLGGAFGGGLAGGFGGLMGSLGLSATGSTLGGAMSAGSIALGSGNILGGLGTIAGALGPIAIGFALLSSLIKKSTPHMGAGVTYSAADGLVRGADQYSQANYGFGAAGEYSSAAESTVGAVARGIATALDSTARTFGQQAGFEISTAFADDKSKDGAWGQLAIRRGGETILDWRDTQTDKWAPRVFSDGEAGLQEYQTAVAQSMREALDKMDLPGWAGDMLDALGDSPSIENLGATLDQINAAQVALEQMGKNLVGFADYTSAAIDALVKAAGGVDSLVSAASTYYDNFYTDAEKAANVTRDVTAALADVGLQMPTTREGFRALVEQQMALGEAGAEAVAALLGVSGAFASVTQAADAAAQAAEQARESAISAAFSGLQRAVKREQEWLQARIDVASEARDALSSLFDLLHDNVQDLYGSVSSTAVQQGTQASAYIAQALATARGTGYLPETDALSDAISAARGGMDATQYATQFEADRDRLVLAGQLAELEGMAGEQLTTAERTLKELQQQNDQLEQTLEYWRDQIELSQAGVDATLSVADAIARLQDAMFPGDKPGSGSGSGSAGGAAGFGPGGITWGGQGPEAKYKTPISLATAGVGYQPVTDPEQIARLDSLSSTYHKYDGTGDLVGLLTAMREAGATTADLSALSGYFESDWRRAAESVGIPAFDVGTNRVPRDMLAVVHKDEAIIPAAYNPWAGGGAAAGGNAELVAEVRALRAELAQLRASSAATASNTAQMADQFDNVSGGGNAVRMEAVA